MNEPQLVNEITPLLAQFDLELDSLDVRPAGRRTLLQIIVDGDGPEGRGPSLDEISEATKAVSRHLDGSSAVGQGAFTLEVSSRGVSRPLERVEHWRRNLGRLVKIKLNDEHDLPDVPDQLDQLEGRITAVTDDAVLLSVGGSEVRVPFEVIKKAVIQVELTKKRPGDAEEE